MNLNVCMPKGPEADDQGADEGPINPRRLNLKRGDVEITPDSTGALLRRSCNVHESCWTSSQQLQGYMVADPLLVLYTHFHQSRQTHVDGKLYSSRAARKIRLMHCPLTAFDSESQLRLFFCRVPSRGLDNLRARWRSSTRSMKSRTSDAQ